MENNYLPESEPNPVQPMAERNSMLSVLCVLSFINAAFNVLGNLISFFFMPKVKTMMEDPDSEMYATLESMYGDSIDEIMVAFETVLNVNPMQYILNALLFVGSFVGVFYMWKLRKHGFHIYAIAQLLILVVAAFAGTQSGIITSAVWTLMWIVAYYFSMKKQGLIGND